MRLYGVKRMGELGGRFWVHVRCRGCQRRACIYASSLAAKMGPAADLDDVKERLRCTTCGARRPWVWSMAEPMEDEEFDELIDFV